jgi:hypothetical protein
LTYLRSRYLDSSVGRFLTRDTWSGETNKPLSLNQWNYVQSNPVNYVDPSGHYWWGAGQALFDASEIKARNQNVHVRIQAIMMAGRDKQIHAEFPGILPIPVPHVDLLDSITGEVWEIKPLDDAAQGALDLSERILALNLARKEELLEGMNPVGMYFDWNFSPLNWAPGVRFPRRQYVGTDDTGWYKIYAGQTSPGIILWWKEKNQTRQPVPYPIVLPDSVTFNERNKPSSQYGGNLIPQPAPAQVVTGVTIVGVCAYIVKEALEFYFCGPCSFVLP